MGPRYKRGQSVRYVPVGGSQRPQRRDLFYIRSDVLEGPDSRTSESVGVIKSVRTEPGEQAGLHVNASRDDPRYEIENANTGKTQPVWEKNILGPADE